MSQELLFAKAADAGLTSLHLGKALRTLILRHQAESEFAMGLGAQKSAGGAPQGSVLKSGARPVLGFGRKSALIFAREPSTRLPSRSLVQIVVQI